MLYGSGLDTVWANHQEENNMCLACKQRREREAKKASLAKRKGDLTHQTLELLIEDKLKGSEWNRLQQMINSPDEENLAVAEAAILQLINPVINSYG